MVVIPTTVEGCLQYEIERAEPQYEAAFCVDQYLDHSGVLPTDDIVKR